MSNVKHLKQLASKVDIFYFQFGKDFSMTMIIGKLSSHRNFENN